MVPKARPNVAHTIIYYRHIMYATRPRPKPIDGRLTQFRKNSYAAVLLRGFSCSSVHSNVH